MKRKSFLPLISLLALAAIGLALEKQDATKKNQPRWPVFRGNSLQTGVADTKLPATLKEQWTFQAAEAIEGTPAVSEDTVFVGSYSGTLTALELATGKKKWEYKGGPFIVPVGYHKGSVYVGDEDGIFHCVDAKTGKQKWKLDVQSEITSGAAFSKDKVLFGTGGELLYCVTLEGKKVWTFPVEGGPVKATPSIVNDETTFVAGCDSALHVIDIKTGKETSSVELDGQVASTAAVSENMLFVGTMTDQVVAIDWKAGKIKWNFQPKKGRQAFYASVALTKDQVIAGCRNRRVYAIERKSGKEIWNYLTRDRIESSPVVVGERVYVASMDHTLYVLGREKGDLIQKIDLGSAVLGSPVVVDGRLLIGTEKGKFFCFGK